MSGIEGIHSKGENDRKKMERKVREDLTKSKAKLPRVGGIDYAE